MEEKDAEEARDDEPAPEISDAQRACSINYTPGPSSRWDEHGALGVLLSALTGR